MTHRIHDAFAALDDLSELAGVAVGMFGEKDTTS